MLTDGVVVADLVVAAGVVLENLEATAGVVVDDFGVADVGCAPDKRARFGLGASCEQNRTK